MHTTISRLLLLASLALLLFPPVASRSAPAGTIASLRITDVGNKSFTVSWTTQVAAAARVNYGTTLALGSSWSDDPGAGPYAHHVSLSGLLPDTTYYFDVISGGNTDNNGGAHYSVTTGPTLGAPSGPDTVYGQVFRPDGTTSVAGAIVYVTVADRNGAGSNGRSATISALSNSAGYWSVNLASIRTADHQRTFSYSGTGGDDLELQADDGPPGRAALTVDLGQSYVLNGYRSAAPPLILSPFNLSGGLTLDGVPVAAGTAIAAWCGGAPRATAVAFTLAASSQYTLTVPGDDPATPGLREGCLPAETVTFKIDSYWAAQALPWVSASQAVTLTASTSPPPAPAPPAPVVSLAGDTLRLSWPDDDANKSYEVWRSSAPYLTPGATGAELLANTLAECGSANGIVTCEDAGAAAGPSMNYFYLVRAGNATDAVSDSSQLGKFGFALQPGN